MGKWVVLGGFGSHVLWPVEWMWFGGWGGAEMGAIQMVNGGGLLLMAATE